MERAMRDSLTLHCHEQRRLIDAWFIRFPRIYRHPLLIQFVVADESGLLFPSIFQRLLAHLLPKLVRFARVFALQSDRVSILEEHAVMTSQTVSGHSDFPDFLPELTKAAGRKPKPRMRLVYLPSLLL